MKKLLAIAMMAVMLACGGNQDDERQVPSADDAVGRGHEAAWTVAHTDHADTIALQRAILDARAVHDEYMLIGEKDAANDFEKAFADSLRSIDPQLAQEIFGN